MKNAIFATMLATLFLITVSCGSKNGTKAGYPPEELSDTAKVAFMMERCEPDSVARYICCTFVGWNEGSTLNSLADAVTYAYNHYKGDDLFNFSNEFDAFSNDLPLPQRMLILSKAAVSDADGLGYQLGLEYAADILANHKTLADVDREMAELKKACGQDSITYLRVLNGLSVAINLPEYKGLPANVRNKYGKAPKMPHQYVEQPDSVSQNADQPAQEEPATTTEAPVENNPIEQ